MSRLWRFGPRSQACAWIALAYLSCLATAPPVAAQVSVPEAIQKILQTRKHPDLAWSDLTDIGTSLDVLYIRSAFEPRWFDRGRILPQVDPLIAEMSASATRGLRPEDYDVQLLSEWLSRPVPTDAEGIARLDTALSAAFARFVRHTYLGRVNPRKVNFGLAGARRYLDIVAILERLRRHPDAVELVAKLDPPFPLFGRLRLTLASYRELEGQPQPPEIGPFDRIRPREKQRAIRAIRAKLRFLGDLPAGAPVPKDESLYDDALVEAVKSFQQRHGLAADGVIGEGTGAALRMPVSERTRQVEFAMERLRWLRRRTSDRFIIVNIPEFRLSAFENGHPGPVMTSNVVVGSAARRNETPIVSADLRQVVFRPYWNVPPSIAKKEIWPSQEQDPSYMDRHDMEVRGGRIRQRPGRNNSLGLIKFLLPNPYHVYLHDTPAKSLFGRTRRDFSHGCIRVALPVDLAEFVLGDDGSWTREDIIRAMHEGPDNRHVELRKPIPVYLLYSTAIVDRAGEVRFLTDIYGHDEELKKLLDKGPPYP